MRRYDDIVHRVFRAIVPGHTVIITPSPQPATGSSPLGLHVSFPVTDQLAEEFFGPVWQNLDAALRHQVVSYLAGHESMHAWEIVRGYEVLPGNTLRGLIANVLADIRGDHLPVLNTLAHWSTCREVAYRLLFEPLVPAADLDPAETPHADALRVLMWGLAVMRCGRLRLADGTPVPGPVHPIYATLWPQVLTILRSARHHDRRAEPVLVEQLLALLRDWTRAELRQRQLPTEVDDQVAAAVVDGDATHSATTSATGDPLVWQDDPPVADETDHGQTTLERELYESMTRRHHDQGCARPVHDDEPAEAAATPWMTQAAIEEITASPLGEQVIAAWAAYREKVEAERRESADQARRAHPAIALSEDPLADQELLPREWATEDPPEDDLAEVLAEAHLIPPLAANLSTVLRPLLEGPAQRPRPQRRGTRLDLQRQAGRIHVQAEYGCEQDPPIWIDGHHRQRGQTALAVALVVDCSTSMLSGDPALAASCHVATASLLSAAADLGGLVDVALAGFTNQVLTIRGLADPIDCGSARQLLAQAQALGGGTTLEPAVAWGLAQLDPEGSLPIRRRLLIMLTDCDLLSYDRDNTAARLGRAPADVLTVLIGLGEVDELSLSKVTPSVIVLPPERTEQLPLLLNQLIEQEVRPVTPTG